MIPSRQILANRANARASTGPRTARGKARIAQNARRHGLAVSLLIHPAHAAAVEQLAHQIAGTDARPELLSLARHVAEAQIDLSRIRQARHDLLARCPVAAAAGSGPTLSAEQLSAFLAIDRYERRALSRRKYAIRELDAARGGLPGLEIF